VIQRPPLIESNVDADEGLVGDGETAHDHGGVE